MKGLKVAFANAVLQKKSDRQRDEEMSGRRQGATTLSL